METDKIIQNIVFPDWQRGKIFEHYVLKPQEMQENSDTVHTVWTKILEQVKHDGI